jgi:hypothetical protein
MRRSIRSWQSCFHRLPAGENRPRGDLTMLPGPTIATLMYVRAVPPVARGIDGALQLAPIETRIAAV